MGKNKFTGIIIAIFFAFTSCTNNSVKELEQIGKQAFEILKNIGNSSKQEYISNFLSIEEARELAKNEDIIPMERSRNELTSTTKEKWEGRIEHGYNQIKEKGSKEGINWQKIEYLDFSYKTGKNDEDIEMCKGWMFFKYDEKSYRVKVFSIYNGKEYILGHIGRLHSAIE